MTELEVQYVADAAANDWYREAGKSVGLFEREFADYLGLAHAAAVPHGTSALHLAMLALDLRPGDEVIVPEATWVATAAPLAYLGAVPVFADADPRTWGIAAESLERCLSPRTRAVVTVDLYGGTPDMDALHAVLGDRPVPILEDAAQAIGSSWRGRPAGTLGDVAVFSFHGTKTLTTGEGGMLVTDRDDLFARVSRLRDHGRTPNDHRFFVTEELGYKYKMSSLQAAFGRAQLQRIDELLGAQAADLRLVRSAPARRARALAQPERARDAQHLLDGDGGGRSRLRARDPRADGAPRRRRHRLPAVLPAPELPPCVRRLRHRARGAGTERGGLRPQPRSVNLPSALMLTEADVDRVCETLVSILGGTEAVGMTTKTVNS